MSQFVGVCIIYISHKGYYLSSDIQHIYWFFNVDVPHCSVKVYFTVLFVLILSLGNPYRIQIVVFAGFSSRSTENIVHYDRRV